MAGIFEKEIKRVWDSMQQKRTALNERCSKTHFCIRQDPEQQRLFGQIRTRLEYLKRLDPRNAATYERNLAGVEADLFYEKPHLERVA